VAAKSGLPGTIPSEKGANLRKGISNRGAREVGESLGDEYYPGT